MILARIIVVFYDIMQIEKPQQKNYYNHPVFIPKVNLSIYIKIPMYFL